MAKNNKNHKHVKNENIKSTHEKTDNIKSTHEMNNKDKSHKKECSFQNTKDGCGC